MNEFLERYYNSDAIKEELNDINNIYYIINYNDKPVGFSKIILNAKHPNTKGWRIYIRTNATAMRVLFLSLITILITYEMSFSQKELERELRKMTIQDKSAENSYIDSLFHLTATKNDEIITDKVDKVYDRYELLLVTKNYEKVVQVYDSGRPIVKSIKNRLTGITFWNQFHENGTLKYTGYSVGSLLHIGNWEEFDKNGKLIKITNHESNRVSFIDIYKTVIGLGINANDIDFTYSIYKTIWFVNDWTTKRKYLIDANLHIRTENLD